MMLYLDTSALVKRYLIERGTADVETLVQQADGVGTSLLTRAEVSATLAKAVRMNLLKRLEADQLRQQFYIHWPALNVIQITETVVALADALAWEHGLRGYDAVHLATAVTWQEALGEPVQVATFDKQLWQAAQTVGLAAWPEKMNDER